MPHGISRRCKERVDDEGLETPSVLPGKTSLEAVSAAESGATRPRFDVDEQEIAFLVESWRHLPDKVRQDVYAIVVQANEARLKERGP